MATHQSKALAALAAAAPKGPHVEEFDLNEVTAVWYRRYLAGSQAPIHLEWGHDNRTTGLRVPASGPAAQAHALKASLAEAACGAIVDRAAERAARRDRNVKGGAGGGDGAPGRFVSGDSGVHFACVA